MMSNEKLCLESVLQEINKKCSIPMQGAEINCPYCNGYAIATIGYDKSTRLRCADCQKEIYWKSVNQAHKEKRLLIGSENK